MKMSKERRELQRKNQMGESNSNWKGSSVGYIQLHTWVKSRLKKPTLCQDCKKVPPHDLANISHKKNKKTYNRDLKNWEWLCRRCHMIKDGRMKIFIQTRNANGPKDPITGRFI